MRLPAPRFFQRPKLLRLKTGLLQHDACGHQLSTHLAVDDASRSVDLTVRASLAHNATVYWILVERGIRKILACHPSKPSSVTGSDNRTSPSRPCQASDPELSGALESNLRPLTCSTPAPPAPTRTV